MRAHAKSQYVDFVGLNFLGNMTHIKSSYVQQSICNIWTRWKVFRFRQLLFDFAKVKMYGMVNSMVNSSNKHNIEHL